MDLESEIDIYYDCDECGQTFSSISEIDNHKLEVHEVDVKRYKCPFCDMSFTKYSNLKNHISHKHSRERSPTLSSEIKLDGCLTETKEFTENGQDDGIPKLNVCEDCNKTFSTIRGLKHHVSIIHERKQQYSCPDCSKTFRLERTLEKHIDKEHLQLGKESQHYKCDECGKMLQSGCLFHVCKNEVPLTCEECGESFVNSDDFKIHKRSFHKSNKYACTECTNVFTDKDKLDDHVRSLHFEKLSETQIESQENKQSIGNNVKKHKCEFCETAFARPENLKRHIQRMHKVKSSC